MLVTNNILKCADYYQGDFITASMDYYLDIINLVQDIMRVNNYRMQHRVQRCQFLHLKAISYIHFLYQKKVPQCEQSREKEEQKTTLDQTGIQELEPRRPQQT